LQLTNIGVLRQILFRQKNKFKCLLCSGNAWNTEEIDPSFFRLNYPIEFLLLLICWNGTACIVWSSELPAYAQTPMRYIDLMVYQTAHYVV
jgi:hypothetical protein